MRREAPALLPIFRSQHQAAILALLLLDPDTEYTLTELATRLQVPLTTLQREVQRLVEAGILQDRTVGRARLVRANLAHPVAAPLTQGVQATFGPQTVIGEDCEVAGQVNPVIRTPEQWAGDADSLVVQIKASPTLDVTAERKVSARAGGHAAKPRSRR